MWFRKPAAMITMTRQTDQEEAVQISVNTKGTSRAELSLAIHNAGEAMRDRLLFLNALKQAQTEANKPTNKVGSMAIKSV